MSLSYVLYFRFNARFGKIFGKSDPIDECAIKYRLIDSLSPIKWVISLKLKISQNLLKLILGSIASFC